MATRTVLVVEDNPITRKMMMVALTAAGHRPVGAEDGAAAIRAVAGERPDVVLQDLVLPDMDGIELARRIRALPEGRDVVLIALSGLSAKLDEARGLAGGFAELLFKPVEPSRVVRLISELLPADRPSASPDGARPDLLLVNDDPVLRKLHRLRLEHADFAVRAAGDGHDALTQARARIPDIVVSDLLMPGMDGLDLCVALRSDSRLRGVPVVLVTASFASIDETEQRLARQAGACAIVPLTPSLDAVIGAARAALEDKPPTESAPLPDPGTLKAAFHERLLHQLERQARLNQTLAREAAAKHAQLEIMAAVADVMAQNRDLHSMLKEVLSRTLDAAGVSLGGILLKRDGEPLRLGVQLGYSGSEIADLERLLSTSPLVAQVLESGQPMTVSAAALGPVPLSGASNGRSEMDCTLLPLVARGKALGLVFLASSHRATTAEWSELAAGIAGQVAQAVALARSIRELQESEERQRAVIDGTPDIIFAKDLQGRFVMVNTPAALALGRRPEEMIGRPFGEFFAPETAAAMEVAERQMMEEGTTVTAEETLTAKGGKKLIVLVTKGVFRDREGKVAGVFGISRDITRARQLESELRQAQKMEAIGRLAGGIAHDFNNVLSVIMSYAGLLDADMGPDDPRRPDVKEIVQASERAARLTRQLLAFSRQQVLEPRILDLNEVVEGVDKMLRRIIGEDVALDNQLTRPLGSIMADPGQLEQVLLNLAVNSRDAMPRGGTLTIATSDAVIEAGFTGAHGAVNPGPYAVLSVTDTGMGMDEATMSQIFEPFFTTKEKGKGTGLGLSTVYGIVAQSGGYIRVRSTVGVGTTFEIGFPRVDRPAEPVSKPTVIDPSASGKETILLVEDEAALRRAAEQILRRHGYVVLTAPDGAAAVAMVTERQAPIHLIVTDVVMPGMSGWESAERLRALHPEARVLYMSGYADAMSTRPRELEPGAGFLQKPFTPAALVGKVRDVLGSAGSKGAAVAPPP